MVGAEPRVEGNSDASRALRKRLCDECKGLSDAKIQALNNRAKKAKQGYTSHADRMRNDSVYRQQMSSQGIPEWLVWTSNGHTSRVDGQPGDQWPVE